MRAAIENHCRDAYSLIELLVSLAVVGILTSILIPAVSGVRRSVHRVEAVNVMRNIGTAMQAFLAENDRLPGPMYTGQSALDVTQPAALSGQIRDYLDSPELFATQRYPDGLPVLHPALTTQAYLEWYLEHRPRSPQTRALYRMREDVDVGPERFYPWGYPQDPSRAQSNYHSMVSGIERHGGANSLDRQWLIGDDYNPLVASGYQPYIVRLCVNWSVSMEPISTDLSD